MKKLLVIIIALLIVSSPVLAFSVRDFLMNFGDIFSKFAITGAAAPPPVCTNEGTRCGYTSECGGYPCVMYCQSGQWIEWTYCVEQCSNGQCISSTSTIINTSNTSVTGTTEPTTSILPTQEESGTTQLKCSDRTLYNQCSNNKPYFCSNGNLIQNCNICGCPAGKDCINNQCIEHAPEEREGEETNDQNRLNRPPIILPIPQKIIKILENIEFEIRAIDPNNNLLTYHFENELNTISTEIISCSIIENKVNCNALKEGEGTLIIIVSDGIDEAETQVAIKVIKELPQFQRGIAAGIANTPPVADAGSDIIGFSGQKIILDASKSYDKEGLLSIPETYKWYENNNIIGTGKFLEKILPLGSYEIRLIVTDSEGLTSEDTAIIKIEEKKACKNTQTPYFPEDTLCNNKWPIREGSSFKINSLTEGSCSLFEVCSDDIDYVIEDSIKCCTEGLSDPEKAPACNFATENSETFKNCQALYTIKSLGKSAVYIQGYFDAEMCCKGVDALCPQTSYLYTPQPLPNYLRGVKCSNTPENNPNGHWASDTKLDLNEIALFDAPAHTSLNVLKTGTCVDYSVSATTLLRKIGFSSDNIMTVEASNHAYNLVRFDLDKKYTIFDMTGNNEGLKLGNAPSGYNYCENIINCYNDFGKVPCPSNKEINGCENAKENIGRTTGTVGYKITNTLKDLFNKIKAEVLR